MHSKKPAQDEKRITELDRLFIHIYEGNAAGRVNGERFAMMSRNHEDEQEQLKAEVQTLQQEIRIEYDLVGYIPLDKLMEREKQETA